MRSSATSYSANVSSCDSAKTSVGVRKAASWMEALWLNVWTVSSSSSAMVVSWTLTRPSVEPEMRSVGEDGWKPRDVTSSLWTSE